MSIPKVIHYCWFGGNELPPLAKKCIKSWKEKCPDYEIVCWNEDNFDLNQNTYMRQAYEAGKWAFVSDYVRLKVVYDYGGIYLDTDVELLKPLDSLLENAGFMGFEAESVVATGLGFGAEKGHKVIEEFLKDYEDARFLLDDGSYDLTPCPKRNTEVLKRLGMDPGKGHQTFLDMVFLPEAYLCPMNYYTGKIRITKDTYSIHHYSASWTSKATKRATRIKRVIGVKLYDKLYGKFLHKFKGLEW